MDGDRTWGTALPAHPSTPSAYGAPPPPPPRRRRRNRGGSPVAGIVAALVALALVGGAIYGLVLLAGSVDVEDRQARKARQHDLRPDAVDDPDLPRRERASELRRYCDDPGQAWDDVPAYDPSEPARLFLWDLGIAPSSGATSRMVEETSWFHPGGALQVSPTIDPRLSEAETADTRIVACVEVAEQISFERSCTYEADPSPFRTRPSGDVVTYGLVGYRYGVVAYELHSGDPVALGFVETPSTCPSFVDRESREPLASALTDAVLLRWVGEHFGGGGQG